MRKTITLLVCIACAVASIDLSGQGDVGGNGFTVEFTASPFYSESLLSPGFLRAKFLAGQLGFRLGAQASVSNTQPDLNTIQHVGFFDLRPGFEFHSRMGKASPYAGIEGIIMHQSANKNSTIELGVANATNEYGANQAFIGYGGALVAGIDYYWGDRFYFGFEVGLDAVFINYKDVEMAGNIIIDATSDFNAATNLGNTFKMGFNF
ncbi:MAG: hypothetical protein K9G38_05435 [Bacteroidales bacterium]|nr:hypothetical protein [Bacteroidales bacterium]